MFCNMFGNTEQVKCTQNLREGQIKDNHKGMEPISGALFRVLSNIFEVFLLVYLP